MEVNGIAHVMLTVSTFDACLPFYEQVLGFLGLSPVLKMDGMLYCVGGRTAVGIVKAEDRWCDARFAQLRVGLHHVCFRARERADVDAVHEFLVGIGAKIVHPPEDGRDRKSTRLNSSHVSISYAVFCLKKKKNSN